MKKPILTITLLLLTLFMINSASAGIKPSINADLSLYNKYVWRGMTTTDEAVLQPSLSFDFMGFGIGLWGNMDLTDLNGYSSKLNEIDYKLSYGLGVPMASLNFGLIYYDFPNTEIDGTTELFVEAKANVLLSPSIGIYADIDEHKGTYIELGAGHSIPLSPALSLNLDATLGLGTEGYTKGYFGTTIVESAIPEFSAGLTNFALTASVPFSVVPMVTVTPSVSYGTLISDAKDAFDAYEDDHHDADALVFGLSAGFNF